MLKNGQLWGWISESEKIRKTTLQPGKRLSVQRMTREKQLIVENYTTVTFKRGKNSQFTQYDKIKKMTFFGAKSKKAKKKGLKTTLQKY